MTSSLGLVGLQFSIATAIFYTTLVVTQIFANVALRFSRASTLLAIPVVAWGLITLLTGYVVNDYKDLLIIRCFLGIAEGFLVPGIMWYITLWYPRDYWPTRLALVWAAPTFASAFGGLIAQACASMNNSHRPSWNYMFIIEGAITMFLGLISLLFLPSSTREARYLTGRQRQIWNRRLEEARGNRLEAETRHYIVAAFIDWKVWAFGLLGFGAFMNLMSVLT